MTCHIRKIKTDYYLREQDELTDFNVDQTVLLKEQYLKYIDPLYKKDDQREFSSLDEWYPFVNSYYPYTEDVDAFARVNHLLESKPSFASLSSIDCESAVQERITYSEKSAQLQYLESEPVSFIILGKPGIGEQDLGKQLADYWHCVYIDPEVLIEQEVNSGSRAGQCIEFNLRCGRAIGIDVVLKLVEKRVKSESAKHRGFVICGLPLIPNDLYEEDPISSESAVFNVKEIFEEVFDTVIEIGVPPSKPQVSISSKYKSGVDEGVEEEEMKKELGEEEEAEEVPLPKVPIKIEEPEIPVDIGPDFDLCDGSPDIGKNYESQLNFIFELMKNPFIIIYIMCSSTDVINKRDSYRFDVYSRQTINLQTESSNKLLFNYISKQPDINYEEIPEEFFEMSYIDIDSSGLMHLVRLPRNFPANVSTQLDSYHYTALNFIERRVLMHDPQYFLKVDGRTNVQRMFHIIKSRLKVLPVQNVLLPTKLNVLDETLDIGEGEPHVFNPEGLTYEECFREFCKRQVPSSIFQWRWSDWGVKCPVSLSEGFVKNGDPNFAVRFMNKMFFLADEEAFFKFYRNPRPYLLPPNPKPSSKIFIFGPKCSGKSSVAKCLCYLLDSTILSISEMLKNFLSQKEEECKEKIRQAAIAEAMKILNDLRIKEAAQLEKQRLETIRTWIKAVSRNITDLINLLLNNEKEASSAFEISSFPMAMKKTSLVEMENEFTIGIRKIKDALDTFHIPYSENISEWQASLMDKRRLLVYLPNELKVKILPQPATVFDQFVIDYAEKAVANAVFDDYDMNIKNMAEIFTSSLKSVEESYHEQGAYRGWIIDGMLCDIDFMNELYPDYMADEFLVLQDEEDFEFLTTRYHKRGENQFWEYRQFFLDEGKIDAAWRCPSKDSTKSYKAALAHDILSEILEDGILEDEVKDGKNPNIENSVEAYHENLIEFSEKWEQMKEFFSEHDIQPLEIKITNKSLPEVLKEVIRVIEDKYRLQASIFTEEDRAEEVRNIGNQMIHKGTGEDGDTSGEDLFEKNRRYGDTYHYCPVTFYENSVLWKGKEDFAVKFEDKLYLLCSETDMNKFLQVPRNYLTGKPPEKFPPPRICIIGVPGLRKTFLAKAVAHNFGLVYISFESLLKTFFNVTSTESLDELRRNEETDVILYNYLNLDEPLPEEVFQDLLCKIWFALPVLGFVLDDFPKRPSDIDFMTKYKLIPDVVICLTINESQILSVLLEQCLSRWETEVNEKRALIEEKNNNVVSEWEESRKRRFDELMEEKRELRYAEKKREKAESPVESPKVRYLDDLKETDEETDRSGFRTTSQVSFDSVAEQEDIDEVTRILDLEMPEVVLDHLEEIDEVRERFEGVLTDVINIEGGFLTNIKALCETEIIMFKEVISDFDYPDITMRNAYVIVDEFKYRTKSHFERCYDVSMEVADRLLFSGYFFLSKFGKTCPVQYHENKNPIQMLVSMEQKYNVFPVIHRNFIYYTIGRENQTKFKEHPLKFVEVENFSFPLIPFRVAVTGPPKSGKSILAERIKNEFGFKLISRGQAARYVLFYLPFSNLATNMESVLRKGWELTDEMVAKCVEAASLDGRAVTQARRVPVPDERFDYLCEYFKPISKVPAFLNVVDIAGLVKGASEGQGLGNAFLSHISACDAIFHLCRAFEDDDVTHVEGEVNPVRDLDIIGEELRLKDEDTLLKNLDKLERTVGRGADKKLKPEYDTLLKVKQVLIDEKKHIRFADWDGKDIEVLNKYLFLTSKPALYLINLAEKDYIKKKNKWLIKIKEWVDKNDPGALIIPFSGVFENKLVEEYEDPALRKKFLEDNHTTSALDKIIVQGYKALQLEYFFTAGPDEVKAWTIQKGTKAPQAAGRIHTDFEKGFIMAEVMKFADFKEEGSEAACKAAGKYRQQGRNYVVEDGDIIFFKFNAGAGLQTKKK